VYPFIHLGPITLGTYGLLVATALLVSYFVLRADFLRRALAIDAETVVGITGLAGLVGARLYHLMESPREFFADPWPLLFSTMGFAWFGSVIAGFIALVLLARHYKIGFLTMLDAASPAAALGYGVGRIGCLISGDGDYGKPTTLPWGMSFPNGIVPTTERIFDRDRNFLDFVAHRRPRDSRRATRRHCFRRVFGAHRRGAILDRVYPHQSAFIFWHDQRAGRQPRLDSRWRASVLVYAAGWEWASRSRVGIFRREIRPLARPNCIQAGAGLTLPAN
jgi:hypothetical protein